MLKKTFLPYQNRQIEAHGVKFDESALKAIRAAERKKWTTLIILGLIIVTGIAVAINSHFQKEKEIALALDYMRLELESQNIPLLEKAQKYENYYNNHKHQPLGWYTGLIAAQLYLSEENIEKAFTLLQSLEPMIINIPIMRVKVQRTLAGLYAEKGQFDQAIRTLEILEKDKENPRPAETMLTRAKILYIVNQKKEALEVLQNLQKQPPNEDNQEEIKEAKILEKAWSF